MVERATSVGDTKRLLGLGHDAALEMMAHHLGIHPTRDREYMYIARKALKTPVPPEWREVRDDGGATFYVNDADGTSSWWLPTDAEYRRTFLRKRAFDERLQAQLASKSAADSATAATGPAPGPAASPHPLPRALSPRSTAPRRVAKAIRERSNARLIAVDDDDTQRPSQRYHSSGEFWAGIVSGSSKRAASRKVGDAVWQEQLVQRVRRRVAMRDATGGAPRGAPAGAARAASCWTPATTRAAPRAAAPPARSSADVARSRLQRRLKTQRAAANGWTDAVNQIALAVQERDLELEAARTQLRALERKLGGARGPGAVSAALVEQDKAAHAQRRLASDRANLADDRADVLDGANRTLSLSIDSLRQQRLAYVSRICECKTRAELLGEESAALRQYVDEEMTQHERIASERRHLLAERKAREQHDRSILQKLADEAVHADKRAERLRNYIVTADEDVTRLKHTLAYRQRVNAERISIQLGGAHSRAEAWRADFERLLAATAAAAAIDGLAPPAAASANDATRAAYLAVVACRRGERRNTSLITQLESVLGPTAVSLTKDLKATEAEILLLEAGEREKDASTAPVSPSTQRRRERREALHSEQAASIDTMARLLDDVSIHVDNLVAELSLELGGASIRQRPLVRMPGSARELRAIEAMIDLHIRWQEVYARARSSGRAMGTAASQQPRSAAAIVGAIVSRGAAPSPGMRVAQIVRSVVGSLTLGISDLELEILLKRIEDLMASTD